MSVYVIDTSALKFRYLTETPHANQAPKFKSARQRMRRLVTDKRNRCFIAENTMFELSSALGSCLRANPTWPATRFDKMLEDFHQDVAAGRLEVRLPTTREFHRVRHLLRTVGVVRRRNLGSLDAIVMSSALELAYELKQHVVLYTADNAMHSMTQDLEPFKSAIETRHLLR